MNVHLCHFPGCTVEVPPKMLACRQHWFALPKPLRDAVRAAYKPGQEITKTPSQAWLDAHDDCLLYWLDGA